MSGIDQPGSPPQTKERSHVPYFLSISPGPRGRKIPEISMHSRRLIDILTLIKKTIICFALRPKKT